MARREVTENDVPSMDGKFLKMSELFGSNGDSFVGLYLSDAEGTYGQDYSFKCRDGSQGILTVKGPLKAQLKKAAPVKGEKVTIKRTGMKGEFWVFSVVVEDAPKKGAPPPKPAADEDDDVPF